jgi:hypothetical protein
MSANIEDFVKRITRINRKFTFIFTEDFFNIMGKNGVRTDRFRDIRNTIRYVNHRKGTNADLRVAEGVVLFDVEVVIVDNGFSCFVTSFSELTNVPFSDQALIYGSGNEGMVDAQKAKFQVESFFAEKHHQSITTIQMLAEHRKRQIILVVENHADLKRPSLEPIRNLRSRLYTILVNPEKGPVVDCQVSKLFQEGNSNSLSTLLNMFCVHYK